MFLKLSVVGKGMVRTMIKEKTGFKNNLIVILIILTFSILNPLRMNFNQVVIFSSLLLVIYWWTTGYVNKNLSCLFLLIIFILFGSTRLYNIVKFAFSPNFYLIIFSFLLSAGISNSKIANRISSKVLLKYGKTPFKLVILSFIFNTILIFIIPQPFSRVILLASIYKVLFDSQVEDEALKEILLFSIFVSSTSTAMFFINGDIILNFSALEFGGVMMNTQEWIRAMLLPSIVVNLIVLCIFFLIFKDKLKTGEIKLRKPEDKNNDNSMSSKEFKALVIIVIVVILWMTEGYHGFNSAYVALLGVVLMFLTSILETKDLNSINFDLMLFLITSFAIGTVMTESGISSIVFLKITSIMPLGDSVFSYLFIILIVMGLHMIVGSSITTLSIVVPSIIQITQNTLNPLILVLLCYITVNIHYVVPFHHVTIMIGSGNSFYRDKLVIKYGLYMTIPTILIILFIFMPWWNFIGIL